MKHLRFFLLLFLFSGFQVSAETASEPPCVFAGVYRIEDTVRVFLHTGTLSAWIEPGQSLGNVLLVEVAQDFQSVIVEYQENRVSIPIRKQSELPLLVSSPQSRPFDASNENSLTQDLLKPVDGSQTESGFRSLETLQLEGDTFGHETETGEGFSISVSEGEEVQFEGSLNGLSLEELESVLFHLERLVTTFLEDHADGWIVADLSLESMLEFAHRHAERGNMVLWLENEDEVVFRYNVVLWPMDLVQDEITGDFELMPQSEEAAMEIFVQAFLEYNGMASEYIRARPKLEYDLHGQ